MSIRGNKYLSSSKHLGTVDTKQVEPLQADKQFDKPKDIYL